MITEFGLHKVEVIGADRASITGRVFTGTLKCGTCFTLACKLEHTSPDRVPRRLPMAEISLTVQRVVCYGREVPFLDEGLTGLIEVTGIGLSQIAPEMSLIAASTPPGSLHKAPRE